MIMKALFHWTETSENINIRIESAPAECRGRFESILVRKKGWQILEDICSKYRSHENDAGRNMV